MAKQSFKSISEIDKQLKKKIFLPVYFLFGEDSFGVSATAEKIEKEFQPFLSSEFDKYYFHGSSSTLEEIVSAASTFPFGSEKKIIVVKAFDELDDKSKDEKFFLNYLESPSDFTLLLLINNSALSKLDKKYLKLLNSKAYLFEAKILKDDYLISWVADFVKEKQKNISFENARHLVELVGSDRNLIESQLEKIFNFLGENKEITFKIINEQVVSTKEYSTFDLREALSHKRRELAFKIAFSLLETEEIIAIIASLNQYFFALSQLQELKTLQEKERQNYSDEFIGQKLGTHAYFLNRDYKPALKLYGSNKMFEIANALLEADLAVKTTSIDEKTVLTTLLAKILK